MTNEPPFALLEITGPPTAVADDTSLDAVELRPGFALPDSYREFATTFGYGLLCNLFIIYVPMGDYGDSLEVRSRQLTAMLQQSMEDDLFEYEPDGSPELVERLIPFAISENGHTLAWDPKQTAGGEPMIYAIGAKTLDVRKAAPSLDEFLARCLDSRVKRMIGAGYSPLPPTFKPLPPRR